MEFYYDAILGLQYTGPDYHLGKTLILDLTSIPKNFSFSEFKERWIDHMRKGVLIMNSKPEPECEVVWHDLTPEPIIKTNAYGFQTHV